MPKNLVMDWFPKWDATPAYRGIRPREHQKKYWNLGPRGQKAKKSGASDRSEWIVRRNLTFIQVKLAFNIGTRLDLVYLEPGWLCVHSDSRGALCTLGSGWYPNRCGRYTFHNIHLHYYLTNILTVQMFVACSVRTSLAPTICTRMMIVCGTRGVAPLFFWLHLLHPNSARAWAPFMVHGFFQNELDTSYLHSHRGVPVVQNRGFAPILLIFWKKSS